MNQIKELVSAEVHRMYWIDAINYARTTRKLLAKLFDIPVFEQTINAAIGLNGAGGYRLRMENHFTIVVRRFS